VKDRRTNAADLELAQRVARECLEPGDIDLGLEMFDRALARAVH